MDANSFFEYLIPALFFVFYIITKIFESRAKKTRPQDSQEGAEPSTVDEVRREIQRRIRERQKQESQPNPTRDIPEMDWAHEPQMAMRPRSSQTKPIHRETSPQEDYLLRLKKEKARLEASRKEAQKAREASRKKQAQATVIAKRTKSQRLHPGIKETLRDPQMARKAYLYHEIFGAPIALRKRGGMFPNWEN